MLNILKGTQTQKYTHIQSVTACNTAGGTRALHMRFPPMTRNTLADFFSRNRPRCDVAILASIQHNPAARHALNSASIVFPVRGARIGLFKNFDSGLGIYKRDDSAISKDLTCGEIG